MSSKWKIVNQQNTVQFKNISMKTEHLCYESEKKIHCYIMKHYRNYMKTICTERGKPRRK